MVDEKKTLYLHPDYVRDRPEWELTRDLYEARHDVVCRKPSILWPHAIEEAKIYSEVEGVPQYKVDRVGQDHLTRRQRRTRYLNLPEIITSMLITFFFKKPGKPSDALKNFLGKQIDDIDGYGNSLETFIKTHVAEPYIKYGKVVTTADSVDYVGTTQADAIAAGARAFLIPVEPISFVDWQRLGRGDNAGKLKFARFNYEAVAERADESVEPVLTRMSRSYSKTDLGVIRRKFKGGEKEKSSVKNLEDSVEWVQVGTDFVTDLENCPIAVLEDVSWLKDVNQETLRFHNLRSSADNILHNSGYQKIFISGMLNVGASDTSLVANETNWVYLPTDSTVTDVEPVDLDAHYKAISECLGNIFKVGLNLHRMLPADSRETQAADAMIQEKENTVDLAKSILTDLENHVNEALGHYSAFSSTDGKPIPGLTWEINKDITIEDVDQFLRVLASQADKIARYPELDKMTFKKAIGKLGLTEDELVEAEKIIDKGATVPEPKKPGLDKVLNVAGN